MRATFQLGQPSLASRLPAWSAAFPPRPAHSVQLRPTRPTHLESHLLASGPRLSGPLCAPGGSFSCPQASFFRLVSSPAGVLLQRSWGLGLSYLCLQCGLGMSPVRVFFNRTFCKALSLRRASSSRATLRVRFCQILCGPGWSHGPVCPQAACARRPATRPARPPICFPNHLAGLLAGLDAFRSRRVVRS